MCTNHRVLFMFTGAASLAGCAESPVEYISPETPTAAPDPAMPPVAQGDDPYAWVVGVQSHVSIMELALHGVPQLESPYAIDDVTWPGTFTVDAGALTLVTLVTK